MSDKLQNKLHPKYCPLGCGESLVFKKIEENAIEYLKKNRSDSDKIDLTQCYGILCIKCGYATMLLEFRK